jgi:hypothetical protein
LNPGSLDAGKTIVKSIPHELSYRVLGIGVKVTFHKSSLHQYRMGGLLRAAGGGLEAPGMKGAAGGQLQRIRKSRAQPGIGNFSSRLRNHDRSEQGPGVRMARVPEDLIRLPLFHDPPQVHDRHPGGHVLHHRQVVADEHVSQPEFFPEVKEQV